MADLVDAQGRTFRASRRPRLRLPARLGSLALAAAIPAVTLPGALTARGSAAAARSVRRSDAAPLPRATGDLDVLPFPGTPDAPPGTDIDFPSLARTQIVSVRVVGSRSGAHRGRLSAQPDGAGTAFAPDRQFTPGEQVRVAATVRTKAAAAAAGAPEASALHSKAPPVLRFSFAIASPAPPSAGQTARGAAARCRRGRYGPRRRRVTHSFHSAPRLHPPVVHMVGRDTDTASGDIFLDADNPGDSGPLILNPRGGLLWFLRLKHSCRIVARDVRVQQYEHHPVLTYYVGTRGGRGVGLILNRHYQVTHRVTAGDGYRRDGIDTHEFALTPEGTALVTVYALVHANLTSVGGPSNGPMYDTIVQEINVATDRVVWEWNALGHVPLDDSYARYIRGAPFAAYHLNSIQQIPGGNILISMRHTWGVYLISKRTGKIKWELGGKHSSFAIGRGAHFEWQHDALLHRNGLLTVFDDGAGLYRSERQSRALEIRLRGRRATLVHAYKHVPPVLAWSQGSVQLLPNHNVFVGWGSVPTFSEYTQAGRQIFTASFRLPVQSYRAYREHWIGEPLGRPSIDLERAARARITLYASWNGATQVVSWRVLTGATKTGLRPIARERWGSFETSIKVRTTQPYLEVQALDAGGKVLGTSNVVSTRKGGCSGPEC